MSRQAVPARLGGALAGGGAWAAAAPQPASSTASSNRTTGQDLTRVRSIASVPSSPILCAGSVGIRMLGASHGSSQARESRTRERGAMKTRMQRGERWVPACVALMLAAGVALAVRAAVAQTTAESTPPTWVEGPTLTGDWGGVRTRLSDRGFAPYAIYTVEGFGVAGKGIDDGADWTSELEFGFDLDTQKLVGLPGGSLHASGLWIEGTDPSDRVGNLNAISSLSAPPAARLYQLWYKQVLGPVTAKIGQVVASDDFMVSSAAALYFNTGFGTYPTFTANINAPSYPLGAPGAVVAWQMVESLQLQTGVYVADA